MTSGPFLVEIVEDRPFLLGVTASALTPGEDVTLLGRFLLSSGSTATQEDVVVVIGTLAVEGKATESKVIFRLPDTATAGDNVPVTVQSGGRKSDPINVTIAAKDRASGGATSAGATSGNDAGTVGTK